MNRPGLTLFELMVAMVVAGLGMSVAYASYVQITTLNQRTISVDRTLQRESAMRDAIIDWLGNARPDSMMDSWRIVSAEYEGRADDRVYFDVDSAAAWIQAPSRVALYIDRDPETETAGLVAEIIAVRTQSLQIVQLTAEVESMTVEFFVATREQTTWAESRTIELRAGEQRAVRIRLEGHHLSGLMSIPLIATRII